LLEKEYQGGAADDQVMQQAWQMNSEFKFFLLENVKGGKPLGDLGSEGRIMQ
jgi:hypothetical protein